MSLQNSISTVKLVSRLETHFLGDNARCPLQFEKMNYPFEVSTCQQFFISLEIYGLKKPIIQFIMDALAMSRAFETHVKIKLSENITYHSVIRGGSYYRLLNVNLDAKLNRSVGINGPMGKCYRSYSIACWAID